MHDEFIRYNMAGTITDGNLVSRKAELIRFLEVQMRDEGIAPNLDVDPQFTLDYDRETEGFNFELSVYGNYVGDKAWHVEGMTLGATVSKYTPPSKSKESSATPM